MNNICVICETNGGKVAEVSLELLCKAHELAGTIGCKVEAMLIGHDLGPASTELTKYGADKVLIADDVRLKVYQSLPYTAIVVGVLKETQPVIALLGATNAGRDLGPRVSSALHSGLTADCTDLQIGEHYEKKNDTTYRNLLYQIRPAFGGNIIATIINPDHRPQMATVREGVMKKQIFSGRKPSEIVGLDVNKYLHDSDFVVKIIERSIEESKTDIKSAPVLISGGYGVGSKENFALLFELAELLGGEVSGSRAAVDAGFISHDRQVGQTGVTVRPKLYIACGISGQVQHTAGMNQSAMIISINNDPNAPINEIADYVITGDLNSVIPKIIEAYKKNKK
ncbi:MAG: electron transfer flavoprotein subunit alpha/FixB family protein [Bacteroidales bacterium]|nr:electron transfer flavoprotein subunit alpha/FixB family protein [Bacteroidales bacterium]HOY39511.1 electron transfer flavoprotein subunit alpha/FixB family protein [Bacteroidales bacterium]HQP05093.1 electron transfer flavoprotein subunit alpha/FixB family protein [Bacteroidales bacterium]